MMGFVGFGCEWFCLDCAFYVVDFVANCGCGCGCDGFCGFFFSSLWLLLVGCRLWVLVYS